MANSINKKNYTKITLISLFLLLYSLVAYSYNPTSLDINCGSSTNTTSLDNRIWIGDNIDNVGQNQVPPNQDTGMFRNWDNDFPLYLEKQYPLSVSSDFGDQLNYLKNTVPNYTAPEVVYLTARSYGMNATEDYNVTWNFEVDSAFTYMVRLHFCEFDWHIKNPGDRVFQIYIDDTLAELIADVIYWSGARLVPVHRDYAVSMYSRNGSSQIKRVNISIKLQRLPNTTITRYRDVTLNGIEIFKISDINNNLFGSNPKLIISPNGISSLCGRDFSLWLPIVLVVFSMFF